MSVWATPAYPTAQHERAAQAIVRFFSAFPSVRAVLLTGSCARGKASADSCLDVAVLVPSEAIRREQESLEGRWKSFYETSPVFADLQHVGRFSGVDLDIIDGDFRPAPRGWTTGPDEFELEIGNTLVYASPLWERGELLSRLKVRWLPYYDESLRQERLSDVVRYCRNNLDHIPLYVERGLTFQSFNRLYDAFQEFLQALFIAHRTYPIAYDKWVREQVEGILGMPRLYEQLPKLLEIDCLESTALVCKAAKLGELLATEVEALR